MRGPFAFQRLEGRTALCRRQGSCQRGPDSAAANSQCRTPGWAGQVCAQGGRASVEPRRTATRRRRCPAVRAGVGSMRMRMPQDGTFSRAGVLRNSTKPASLYAAGGRSSASSSASISAAAADLRLRCAGAGSAASRQSQRDQRQNRPEASPTNRCRHARGCPRPERADGDDVGCPCSPARASWARSSAFSRAKRSRSAMSVVERLAALLAEPAGQAIGHPRLERVQRGGDGCDDVRVLHGAIPFACRALAKACTALEQWVLTRALRTTHHLSGFGDIEFLPVTQK